MAEIAGASIPLVRDRLIELSRIAHANLFQFAADGDTDARAVALEAIGEMASALARAAALADVRARAAMIRSVESRVERQIPVGVIGSRDSFFTMPFAEAVNEILGLTPIESTTAAEVTRAYSRREFSLRQGIALDVTRAVQAEVARLVQTGGTVEDFVKQSSLLDGGHVSDAYARTVFRTEVTRAQTAGRIQQATSPELAGFVVAWRYNAVGDRRTRPNHRALDRKMWAVGHAAWREVAPPNGWNCRCRLINVTRFDAKRMGRLDDEGKFVSDPYPVAGGTPDEGFERSPAVEIYGS